MNVFGVVDWQALATVAVPVVVGCLTVAWRLGRLEGSVKDLTARMEHLEHPGPDTKL